MKRLLLLSLFLTACEDGISPSVAAAPQLNRMTSETRFITVAPGVNLEVVDYGGRGDPLVLLAGSGNTAHVYATFAQRFTDRYHVLALTRRGFGASSQPASGYDTRTLSEDLLAVLDSLRLPLVNLVGHSLAGDEMTRFAGDHGDRVRRLVYVDAAYDRVALGQLIHQFPFPPPPAPTAAELASPEGFSRYIARVRGVELPMEEIVAQYRFAPTGAFLGEVTPPEVYTALLGEEESPDYTRVVAPALGMYAVGIDAGDIVPWLDPSWPLWSIGQEVFHRVYAPFYLGQRVRFATEVAHGTLRQLAGENHYLFLSSPDVVATAVRAFLQ